MISHRTIMTNLALALRDNTEIRDYCIENFGRGLAINVGAYAAGIPDVKDSPFLWIQPKDENESVGTDETFTVRLVVGGAPIGANGEKVIENVITERTASANGLVVNGGNKIVEDLRDLILVAARSAPAGALVAKIRRDENDIAHFPLEWANVYIDYFEPVSLVDSGK